MVVAPATPSLRSITFPEASGTSYLPCTDAELAVFSSSVMAEANDCATRASYDWNSAFLPTGTERVQLCDCTALINKLETLRVPHCTLYRNGALYSYKHLTEYAFGLCDLSGKLVDNNIATLAPGSSDTSSSKNSSSNTGVIVGAVVGVVVIVGAIVGVLLYKRKRNANDKEVAVDVAPHDVQGALSPLGHDGNAFTKMSPRKDALTA